MKTMKKTATILALCLVSTGLWAMTPMAAHSREWDDIYRSPTMISEAGTGAYFEVGGEMGSSFEFLSYLANPSGTLTDDEAERLLSGLLSADLSWWEENYDEAKDIFSFDNPNNIPSKPGDEASLAAMRAYLSESFGSRFSDSQKASAVIAASGLGLFSESGKGNLDGGLALKLSLGGGNIYSNGFAWEAGGGALFHSPEAMLNSDSSTLAFDMRGKVGYAFSPRDGRLTLGIGAEAYAGAWTDVLNRNLLSARFNADPVGAFSEDFILALGVGVNVGVGYRVNEELMFTLDAVDLVNLKSGWAMELTDFVEWNGLEKVDETNYVPMDIVFRARWDSGQHHVVAEISDIVSQLIWMNEIPWLDFDFFAVPKVRYAYDINPGLAVTTSLGSSELGIGLAGEHFDVEASYSFSCPGLSVAASWKM